jgi:hypothetical protein
MRRKFCEDGDSVVRLRAGNLAHSRELDIRSHAHCGEGIHGNVIIRESG